MLFRSISDVQEVADEADSTVYTTTFTQQIDDIDTKGQAPRYELGVSISNNYVSNSISGTATDINSVSGTTITFNGITQISGVGFTTKLKVPDNDNNPTLITDFNDQDQNLTRDKTYILYGEYDSLSKQFTVGNNFSSDDSYALILIGDGRSLEDHLGVSDSNSSYPGSESPARVIDRDINRKYLNYAKENSGIIVTPNAASTVASIKLSTANDAPGRDPASFILYGTNEAIASADNSLGNGEAWTEIEIGRASCRERV